MTSKQGYFKAIAFLFVLVCSLSSVRGAAAAELKNDTKVFFDFSGKQVQFYGVYTPGKDKKRGGLEAEIAARRNGIIHLNSQILNSCGKNLDGKGDDSLASPKWQGSVKSQGSEIFANGVLKISLVAPIKEVLKENAAKKPSSLKTTDGAPLALKIPKLPVSALSCGVITINVGGRSFKINPLSGSTESGAKVVNLALDGSSSLKPAANSDTDLLERSSLVTNGDADGATPNNNSSSEAPATTSPATSPAP